MSGRMLYGDGKLECVAMSGIGQLPQGPLDENEHGIGVVLNDEYGGFDIRKSITNKGLHLLQERGKHPARCMSRVDPDLVFLAESYRFTRGLVVKRIPREIVEAGSYRVYEFDGKEFLVADFDAHVRVTRELAGAKQGVEQVRRHLDAFLGAIDAVLYGQDCDDDNRMQLLRMLLPAAAPSDVDSLERLGQLAENAACLPGVGSASEVGGVIQELADATPNRECQLTPAPVP